MNKREAEYWHEDASELENITNAPLKRFVMPEYIDAFKVVVKTIRDDEGLYITYQSCIAMAFQDEMHRAGYKLPDLHKIANKAAEAFLSMLIRKGTEGGA